MFNLIVGFIFKLLGWKVLGQKPQGIKKAIFIVCPHYTWFDFLLGLGSRAIIKMPIGFLGKKELFDNKLYGWFFYATGGHPVDRFSTNGVVGSVKKLFDSKESLFVAIAPEGTRKNVSKLRTGFYYMALASKVPILFVGFEFPTKSIIFNPTPFYPTGNIEEDMKVIAAFFKTIKGKQKDWLLDY
jgi:1-acyl-sn-glycerol-3-phosphate acyltransferase